MPTSLSDSFGMPLDSEGVPTLYEFAIQRRGSPLTLDEMVEFFLPALKKIALDSLREQGIVLEGHPSAINALIERETDDLVEAYREQQRCEAAKPKPKGRPRRSSTHLSILTGAFHSARCGGLSASAAARHAAGRLGVKTDAVKKAIPEFMRRCRRAFRPKHGEDGKILMIYQLLEIAARDLDQLEAELEQWRRENAKERRSSRFYSPPHVFFGAGELSEIKPR